MKSTINFFKLKHFVYLSFLALMLTMSCQNEETEIINPSNEDIIEGDSTAANLMLRMASNDGSEDNIVDYANCLEVVLPVTVTANGVTITIQSVADYSQLENILDAFTNDDDQVNITFPITVTLNNYTEIQITSQQELEELIDDCLGENEDDDDIECIDFVYPVSFSIYNTDFQVINTVTINNDEALYNFLEDLDGPILASLDFPVTLITASGNTVIVNNNQELEVAISDADGTCDEDDDYDWNDDDNNCTDENVELNLKECLWDISNYNNSNVFSDYYIDFNTNYEFSVLNEAGNIIHDGSWSVTQDGAIITLNFTTDWEDLAGDWTIVNCDDEDEYNLDNGQITMQIEQDCTVSNNPLGCLEANDIVKCDENNDGLETFNLYEGLSDIDGCTISSPVQVSFHETIVDAETNVNAIPNVTAYSNISSPQTIYVRIEVLNNPSQFEILELGLILEDCSLNCTASDVNSYLQTCVWNVVNLNGSDNLLNFNLTFEDNADIAITDTDNANSYNGYWNVTEETSGEIILELANISGPNIQAISDYWSLIECDSDRLKFENASGEYLILEQLPCYTEADLFNTITECDWTVYSYINTGVDQTSTYAGQTFTFNENEFVYAVEGETVNYGSLSAENTASDQLVVLFAMQGTSSGLGGYYTVTSITEDYIIFSANGTTLKLEKECNNTTDGDVDQIQNWLYDGVWQITYSTMEGVDNTSDYSGITFNFSAEANIQANNAGTITNLQGEVVRDENNNLRYVINYLGIFPYWQMDDDWYITEVNSNRLELHHVNNDNNNEFVFVVEKM
ncbi:hypothetical protein [Mesoflavibacter zeaxanthinifaciens]|uniref:hypothetical protein n=1 Tax=Mesoflavibacter zeaxanthinifaciens TaxID=393060 RepID=UPI0003FA9913|nr:hypothetical protein [Mesoflavibacter zeaxanthinifaciens]